MQIGRFMLMEEHLMHFTNPLANAPEDGMAFNENANRRSWEAMNNFLEEIFS